MIICLDDSAVERLKTGMAGADMRRTFLAELHRLLRWEPRQLSAPLETSNEAPDRAPVPVQEWKSYTLLSLLGLLARLLGNFSSSARRSASGTRTCVRTRSRCPQSPLMHKRPKLGDAPAQ